MNISIRSLYASEDSRDISISISFLLMLMLMPMVIHMHIHFKILLLAFKVIHGQAPAYLSSLESVKSKSYYSLRSNYSTLLEPPKDKRMRVTLGGRSFLAAVPQLWNALPPSLRDIASVETFKKNLKTFLFRKAFADRFTLIKF